MSKVKLYINNTEIEVDSSKTVFEAAKENGIFIPTFCHDERLKPEASCRVCVVEVEGNNKLQTSCNLPVKEGQKIFTNSEKAANARNEVLELMWASHPNDCVVCDANVAEPAACTGH